MQREYLNDLLAAKARMAREDAAAIAEYLARGGKVTTYKPDFPKGDFLGWSRWQGKTRKVYSPLARGTINEKKAKAIVSQKRSWG